MNKTLWRTVIAMIGLASVLLALACAGGGNGNNHNQGNSTPVPAEVTAAMQDPACDGDTIQAKYDAVVPAVSKGIKGDLKSELDKGVFSYSLDIAGEGNDQYIQMTIRGYVGDFHNKDHTKDFDDFGDLVNLVKKFVRKQCVRKVIFMPKTVAKNGSPAVDNGGGFVWFACDEPTHACSDGSCAENCNKTDVNANNGGTSNSNSNSSRPNSDSNVSNAPGKKAG